MQKKFLLSIPIFNEEKTISEVIKNTLNNLPAQIDQILLINDGSTDQSKDLIDIFVKKYAKLHPIHRKNNLGYGSSMVESMKYAKKNGFDYLITMDCDFQHRPEDIIHFMSKDLNIDVVSGSRYLPSSKTSGYAPEERVKINTKITKIINKKFNWNLSDSFCGFKRYKIDSIDPDSFNETGYAFPMQFWSYCYVHHLTIDEIPVSRIYTTDDRSFGEDLDRLKKRYKYYLKTLHNSLKTYSGEIKQKI